MQLDDSQLIVLTIAAAGAVIAIAELCIHRRS